MGILKTMGSPTSGCNPTNSNAFHGSAEGEGERLDAGIEEFDLEPSIDDGLLLHDQLVHPRFGNCAVALVVYVTSVSGAGQLSIYKHTKSQWVSAGARSHDQMKIAGVKSIRNAPAGLIQH